MDPNCGCKLGANQTDNWPLSSSIAYHCCRYCLLIAKNGVMVFSSWHVSFAFCYFQMQIGTEWIVNFIQSITEKMRPVRSPIVSVQINHPTGCHLRTSFYCSAWWPNPGRNYCYSMYPSLSKWLPLLCHRIAEASPMELLFPMPLKLSHHVAFM